MEETRITQTSTGQYDMLLAISQDSINAAIRAMWDIEGDELETVNMKIGILGEINAKINDVKVQVLADGTGRGGVLVRLEFASGTYKPVDDDSEPLDSCNMEGWKLCFRADIGLNNILTAIKSDEQLLEDPNAQNPKKLDEIKARLQANEEAIKKFGNRAGDYSIQRLFIDFTSKAALNCAFPLDSWLIISNSEANYSEFQRQHTVTTGLPSEAETSFSLLMGKCTAPRLHHGLAKNKKEDQSVIGYGLAVEKEDVAKALKVANCLVPTQLVLNTYGYKAKPSSEIPLGWSGDADRNCVVYSDMTEGREVQGERMLRWSGNFTSAATADKERRIDGSMCLRRGLFLDRYIIKLLPQYNDDMQIVPEYMNLTRDGGAGQRRYHWTFGAKLGYNKDHSDWQDSYFNLTENAKVDLVKVMLDSMLIRVQGASLSSIYADPAYANGHISGFDAVKSTTGVSWSWDKREGKSPDNINEDWTGIIKWTDHCSGSMQAWTHVDVIPVPGQNKLKLRGISKIIVKMDGYYTRLTDDNLDYKAEYIVAAFWQVDYAVEHGADGLGCRVDKSDCFVRIEDSWASGDFKEHASGDAKGDDFTKRFKTELPKMLKEKDAIAKAMNDSLNATGKFTHPATGSFNLYDPMFNDNGDLLASVRYNAPSKKDKLNVVRMPVVGDEVKQPGPSDPSKAIAIKGDVTAPMLGKKG
ncbi:MAG: hypothetical protein Q9218_002080, partial [Villophora microphyllina]